MPAGGHSNGRVDLATSAMAAPGVRAASAAALARAAGWAQRRTYHHRDFSAGEIASERAERGLGVSVCLPARECAATIAQVVGELLELQSAGVIDQLAVIDAASTDGTGELAARAGAEVYQEAALMSSCGPVLGKGDAMWREPGLAGIAQVDLEEHRHRHQPLSALAPMALTVLATVARRLERDGALRSAGAERAAAHALDVDAHAPAERPPLSELEQPAAAGVPAPGLARDAGARRQDEP